MKLFSTHKWFFGTLILWTLMGGGTSIAIILKGLQLNDSKKKCQLFKSELKTLSSFSADTLEKDLELSNANLSDINNLRNRWLHSFNIGEILLTPIECYLNLGRDIEFIKNKALLEQVVINSNCYLSFTKYLGRENLPALESIGGLDEQLAMVKDILGKLIKAAPREILFIKREAAKGEMGLEDDIFEFPYYRRLRIHEIFDSKTFKVSFIGTTNTLRLFLNEIESMENPIFIREIEIHKNFNDRIPLSSVPEYSVMSVILELLNLKEPVR